jgi:hypothetical protein
MRDIFHQSELWTTASAKESVRQHDFELRRKNPAKKTNKRQPQQKDKQEKNDKQQGNAHYPHIHGPHGRRRRRKTPTLLQKRVGVKQQLA